MLPHETEQDSQARDFFRSPPWIALAVIGLVAATALVRDTRYQGQDFEVFWRAGRHLLNQESPYDFGRDGAMVFKYPPWIAALTMPLGLMSLEWAKWVWGVGEIFSLGTIVQWLYKNGAKPRALAMTLAVFWGVLAVHAMDGQSELLILAVVLHSLDLSQDKVVGGVWIAAALIALSAKVFSLIGGFALSRAGLRRALPIALISAGVLTGPVLIAQSNHDPRALTHSWIAAASSGGRLFDSQKIRGRDNQGLPALVLRALNVPAEKTQDDLIVFLVVAALLGTGWWRASRGICPQARAAGWLLLIPIAHPLSWFHLWVFALPAAALALQSRKWAAMVGTALVTVVTRKTLGDWGATLELFSIKAIGGLILLYALTAASLSKQSAPSQRGLPGKQRVF